jgi:hypothetical protein
MNPSMSERHISFGLPRERESNATRHTVIAINDDDDGGDDDNNNHNHSNNNEYDDDDYGRADLNDVKPSRMFIVDMRTTCIDED